MLSTRVLQRTSIVTHKLALRRLGRVRVVVLVAKGPEDPPLAVVYRNPGAEAAPIVRIQSRCLYGEVLGAKDCDCRDQLDESLRRMKRAGSGILIHLGQEGRGQGVLIKAKGYALLDSEGLDTVDAYRRLKVKVDKRTYRRAARLLKLLGVRRLRLLTNNLRKVQGLRRAGLVVRRVPLVTPQTRENALYLQTKKRKLQHRLPARTIRMVRGR